MRPGDHLGPAFPTPLEIKALASETAFGKALVTNSFRGLIAEAIVASALGADWNWCSADYWAWDFERDGIRLEVRQSAIRQTWRRGGGRPSDCRFDIKPRKGRYEGADWFGSPGRSAAIYIFAHHFIDTDETDHRDPRQWRFFVVAAAKLPEAASIGIGPVSRLSTACTFYELAEAIEEAGSSLTAG